MSNHEVQKMKEAVEQSREYRREYGRALNRASNNTQGKKKSGVSTKRVAEDWESCRALQESLLDAEFKVISLAASGTRISDYTERCKTKSASADRDIAFELEQLFSVIVRPTAHVRQVLNRSTITVKGHQWARQTIIMMLKYPLNTFFKMADLLANVLLENINSRYPFTRIRAGLFRILMFVSDCLRYSLDHQKSKDAAKLMQIISPQDPEAHMRLAMNLSMLKDNSEPMEAFFHYCVFLANRKVPVLHNEAVVVSKFVKSLPIQQNIDHGSEMPALRKFFFREFIFVLWSILSDDTDAASKKCHGEALWDAFQRMVNEGLTEIDMQHLVGALIFTHHRISPRGNSTSSLLPKRELCDFVVGKVIRIVTRGLIQVFQDLNTALRARKKNRRRAMQKKRKHDGVSHPSVPAVVIGYDVLNTMVNLNKSMPSLGALSLLAKYWSQARSAPSPSADITPLGRTFFALRMMLAEMTRLEEITGTSSPVSFILTRILSDTQDSLPAMREDLKFCNFLPCLDYDMFNGISLPEVPLPSIFKKSENGIVRQTLKTLGDQSYETFVSTTAQRHLEAFSTLICRELPESECKLEKNAARTLVCLAVRKLRIDILASDLAKVGGGRVARMSLQSLDSNKDIVENASQSDALPPPGQPRDAVVEDDDSLHERITESQLGMQVRKRRRVIGTCTAHLPESLTMGSRANRSTADPPAPDEPPRRAQNDGRISTPSPAAKKTSLKKTDESKTPVTAPRPTANGGILSQGSLHLQYAQTPPKRQKDSKADAKPRVTKLYTMFRDLLYPPDEEIPSPPSDMEGPAYWRKPPKGEYSRVVFEGQPKASGSASTFGVKQGRCSP